MMGFGSGLYSLLSADDALKGAVPVERLSASLLLVASFLIAIVACAGFTSVVINSNVLLFVYFVFNLLVYTVVVATATGVYALRPHIGHAFASWCPEHPEVDACRGAADGADADARAAYRGALDQIEDHLDSVGQSGLVMSVMLLVNLVATFVLMQQSFKPTLYGWTHPAGALFGGQFSDDDWHQDVRGLGGDPHVRGWLDRHGDQLQRLGEGYHEEDALRLAQAYSPRGGPVVGDNDYLTQRLYQAGSDSD